MWLAIVIYCLLVSSVFVLPALVKKKFNLPKNMKHVKFNKKEAFTIILIGVIFAIGSVMANITILKDDIYRTLNPIPLYLWLSLFFLVIYSYRGYLIKKSTDDSKEYYIYFTWAGWMPIVSITAHFTTKYLLY
ncbi:DUF4181 domain-containing protein [Psychrobacillus sp. NPDC058041]|uniref:DUF4181 domain-containing protein n=1 Tax=Psychrobacillus sp. NPDC058041 TaxID=3346310 RepID=UPI0036DBFCD9